MSRLLAIIKMDPNSSYDIPPHPSDLSQYGRYGLGRVRDVERFYEMFGIDVVGKMNGGGLCRYVTTGKMHRKFSKELMEGRGGIDYEMNLKDFVVPDLKW